MANIKHGTLSANTVAEVDLSRDFDEIEVMNRDGAAEIFFTVNGADPTVNGDDCNCLPAAIGSLRVSVTGGQPTVVKLKSAGTPKYSVAGVL